MDELIERLHERAEFEDKRVLDEAKAMGFEPEVYTGSQTGALLREAAAALEAAREDAAEAKQNGYELGLLAAAREAAWQPIETCPNADRVVMFCDERQNIWTDCAWDRSSAATGFYATHWRPLPAPPAIDQARGKGVADEA